MISRWSRPWNVHPLRIPHGGQVGSLIRLSLPDRKGPNQNRTARRPRVAGRAPGLPGRGRVVRARGAQETLTGLPVRDTPRLPTEPRPHPVADCYVVAPASANYVAKLATGVSDNQALTQVGEPLGTIGVPVVVFPWVNAAHARHPAWQGHLETLRKANVDLVYGPDVWPLYEPREGPEVRELALAHNHGVHPAGGAQCFSPVRLSPLRARSCWSGDWGRAGGISCHPGVPVRAPPSPCAGPQRTETTVPGGSGTETCPSSPAAGTVPQLVGAPHFVMLFPPSVL
ncbi:flavoprotein [Streptomyces sp. 061-3]|uniref:flavoprotein n=1 Tax=Streptomyces sp. 061-3 TaxID=2789268 RepID=UPI00397EA8D1